MDCHSEEQLIRTKPEGFEEVKKLSFDNSNHKLEEYHTEEVEKIFIPSESSNLMTS